MDKKAIEAEKGDFRAIWNNDSENKVAEIKRFNESKLTKMKETISLMKDLIEKGKDYKLPEDTPTEDKKQLETELNAREGFTKRNKAISAKIQSLIREAEGLTGDYEKLEVKIKEIDKYEG